MINETEHHLYQPVENTLLTNAVEQLQSHNQFTEAKESDFHRDKEDVNMMEHEQGEESDWEADDHTNQAVQLNIITGAVIL